MSYLRATNKLICNRHCVRTGGGGRGRQADRVQGHFVCQRQAMPPTNDGLRVVLTLYCVIVRHQLDKGLAVRIRICVNGPDLRQLPGGMSTLKRSSRLWAPLTGNYMVLLFCHYLITQTYLNTFLGHKKSWFDMTAPWLIPKFTSQ